jgi:hypothetical protein
LGPLVPDYEDAMGRAQYRMGEAINRGDLRDALWNLGLSWEAAGKSPKWWVEYGMSMTVGFAGARGSGGPSARAAELEQPTVTIESSGSARLTKNPRAPVGKVSPIQPGETPVTAGQRIHQELPQVVEGQYGKNAGTFRIKPGQTGHDWSPPPEVNARFGEMKPITSGTSGITRQAGNWGYPAEGTNPTGPSIATGRYFFYDRATGAVWEGIITR